MAILNGRIVDGTGNPWFKADIGIQNGRISEIGQVDRSQASAVIDAHNLIVCPGFIDIHAHSDLTLLVNPKAESKVRQGVATEVVGNCGFSAAPIRKEAFENIRTFTQFLTCGASVDWDWLTFSDYLRKLERTGISINVAPLVGHGTLRVNAMGFAARLPTDAELSEMKRLLTESMEQGALGMSSGLGYSPACHASTDELVDLCEVVAKREGVYTTHIRDEADEVVEAAQEAVEIGAKSGVRVEINHYKPEGRGNWKKLNECLEAIESGRQRGVDVTYDVYPYIAGEAPITHTCFVPPWAQEGGTEKLIERLQDPQIRERIREEARDGGWKGCIVSVAGWDDCLISFCGKEKSLQGKTILEIAKDRGISDPFDLIFDLMIEEQGAVNIVVFAMNEEVTCTMIRSPWALVASDGMAFAPYGVLGQARPHPRYYGTFPRLLGKYVREDRLLTLQDAIRRITSLPAQKLGLRDRGLIRVGSHADIVIFDPQTVSDKATFANPHEYPEGIRYVLVNGQVTIDDGRHMGVQAGQVLRKI
jgi:N-acyl-D-amino-acid deacylase